MPEDRRPPLYLRLLAPLALVLFTAAFVAALAGSGVFGSDGGSGSGSAGGEPQSATKQERGAGERKGRSRRSTARERARRREQQLPQNVYTVKTGDTLGSIADETGVPVERLQELNPDVDPQALVAGQKLKLRE